MQLPNRLQFLSIRPSRIAIIALRMLPAHSVYGCWQQSLESNGCFCIKELRMYRTVPSVFASCFSSWPCQPMAHNHHPTARSLSRWRGKLAIGLLSTESSADSGPIKKGDTVRVHFSLRWAPDRSYMVNNSTSYVNGKRIANGLEIISWDPEKSIISHAYHGTWGNGTGVWEPAGDSATLSWTIRGEFGTFKGTSHVTKGEDSWQWQIRDQTQNGKPMPEMPVATFRRKVGAPAGDLWAAYCKMAVGKWEGDGKLLWDIPKYEMSRRIRFGNAFPSGGARRQCVAGASDFSSRRPIATIRSPCCCQLGR